MQRRVCVFAAFEVTQLCVSPQWSIWKAVRETNDCRYIDCCSLPPPPALLPQWPVLYFSFPPPFHVTSFLFFSSISVLTFPFPICSTNVSPLDLFLSPFYRIANHVTVICGGELPLERADMLHILKHCLSRAWLFKLTLRSWMLYGLLDLLIKASMHKHHECCCKMLL